MRYDIKNIKLSPKGKLRVEWADNQMPVLQLIRKQFKKTKPLKGLRISACLHVTAETANLMLTLKEGGARSSLCASNPLSTQDDVAAYLVKQARIPVFAIKGESKKTYYQHIKACLKSGPQITLDDGADLVSTIHHSPLRNQKSEIRNQKSEVMGGTEETTTGVIRLRALANQGKLRYPIIAVNDADTKHFFDNRYGTGQSTIDGIIRATNVLLAGKNFVVCGYGWCGKGVAMRARGMGANVIVTEVEPLRALEAVMDGFRVMGLLAASRIGDIFVTVAGDIRVLDAVHFRAMKDGAIVANSGHFNVEINIPGLNRLTRKKRKIREFVEEYTFKNGKKIYLLAEGRLINLAAAEGHPSLVMDMSFANQALSVEYIAKNAQKLENKVYKVPATIDRWIARLKLKSMGSEIDKLTPEQARYLASWELGT